MTRTSKNVERTDDEAKKDVSLIELLDAWESINNAAIRILTAQPHQMTAAAERLETTRLAMQDIIQNYAVSCFDNQNSMESDDQSSQIKP